MTSIVAITCPVPSAPRPVPAAKSAANAAAATDAPRVSTNRTPVVAVPRSRRSTADCTRITSLPRPSPTPAPSTASRASSTGSGVAVPVRASPPRAVAASPVPATIDGRTEAARARISAPAAAPAASPAAMGSSMTPVADAEMCLMTCRSRVT
jgi:hypothetical protein